MDILCLNKIDSKGIEILEAGGHTVHTSHPDPHAIVLRSASLHELQFGPSLLAISRAGVGTNNIPVERCSRAGIPVFNTPGANANSVKETVIFGLLLASRRIYEGLRWVEETAASDARTNIAQLVEEKKAQFAGSEIEGKVLGVIGLGAVGTMVANAAVSLGMKVYGYDPYITLNAAWNLSHGVIHCETLSKLLATSDYITLHVPYNDVTKGLIGAEHFKAMKKGMCFLNFSRDELVDHDALLAALTAETVTRYVTDFPKPALLDHPNIYTLPHLGASTQEAEVNCAITACRQLQEYLKCGNIVSSCNFPQCTSDMNTDTRFLISNRNIPNIVSQISDIISSLHANIQNFTNRHRDDIAYNIIDINTAPSKESLDALRSIEGVLKVRVVQKQSAQ